LAHLSQVIADLPVHDYAGHNGGYEGTDRCVCPFLLKKLSLAWLGYTRLSARREDGWSEHSALMHYLGNCTM